MGVQRWQGWVSGSWYLWFDYSGIRNPDSGSFQTCLSWKSVPGKNLRSQVTTQVTQPQRKQTKEQVGEYDRSSKSEFKVNFYQRYCVDSVEWLKATQMLKERWEMSTGSALPGDEWVTGGLLKLLVLSTGHHMVVVMMIVVVTGGFPFCILWTLGHLKTSQVCLYIAQTAPWRYFSLFKSWYLERSSTLLI